MILKAKSMTLPFCLLPLPKFFILDINLILVLCAVAFCAGFVDSIVGGGGLIQTPLSLAMLPQFPVATVIGSLKVPAFSGTALATTQYLKRIKVQWKLFVIMAIIAFISAYIGSGGFKLLMQRLYKNSKNFDYLIS